MPSACRKISAIEAIHVQIVSYFREQPDGYYDQCSFWNPEVSFRLTRL
jgi:hypothetical protein